MRVGGVSAAIMLMLLGNVSARELNSDGDFQGWYTFGVSSSSKGWKLKYEEELRGGSDWHNLYYNHMDVSINRSLYSWLDAGINYRQVEEIKGGEWTKENRPHLNWTFKWPIGGWAFTDRNRLEFRDFESGQDKWRYRNRFTAYFPVSFCEGKIKPYFSHEIFVDLHGDGLLCDRSYAGFEWNVVEWLKADASYFWNSRYRDAEWSELHVIQLKCDLMF